MIKCSKCGEYNWDDKSCNCKPFKVYYPEYYGDEKEIVYGLNHKSVVEKIAQELNQDDPEFDTDIFESPIIVTDINGIEKSFNCVAMIDIIYSVREQ